MQPRKGDTVFGCKWEMCDADEGGSGRVLDLSARSAAAALRRSVGERQLPRRAASGGIDGPWPYSRR